MRFNEFVFWILHLEGAKLIDSVCGSKGGTRTRCEDAPQRAASRPDVTVRAAPRPDGP